MSLTITRQVFNENILEIIKKSSIIGDCWKLKYYTQEDKLKSEDPSFVPNIYIEKEIQQKQSNQSNQSEATVQAEQDDNESDTVNTHSQDILTTSLNVIYSDSFNVPILYLNVYKSNGKCLSYEELYKFLSIPCCLNERESNELSIKRNELVDLYLTQQEHPVKGKPFFFLHPCRTGEWMAQTAIKKEETNYSLRWMSFIFSQIGIKMDIKYATMD
jgi:ubiquitin-like-conjugating enzyme ATG10